MNPVSLGVSARFGLPRPRPPAGLLPACQAAALAAVLACLPCMAQVQVQPAAGAGAAPGVAAPASAPAGALQALQWLAGCWQSELDEPGSGEQWMSAAGGTMLGMARTLKGGRTVQFEFMQLRESALGLVFIAHPSGQAGTRFLAVEAGESAAVFERGGADFPQRVIYRLRPDGRLAARIEGQRNGEWRGVDFPLRRTACDGPAAAGPASGGVRQGG
jgi:Domain of unknown function (DUF6265)